ncbi:carbohydrate ABC transporter permease [Arthrobacter sp. SDTb3-6]|uniref:carbohydrate ABC transporter permease n=1 Tax=Arthrobacter sp. SDTb3-6 TaxID=2713571 RepID=UPI00159D4907|nr:carbohydrate ABC transporter permease [Arthrobacter sp. SDTb3-6]NVM98288.1 carbohydrate ABC transporter permease [Arthrobacter sp. SDTb3-6]
MEKRGRPGTILGMAFLAVVVVPPVHYMVIASLKPRSAIYRTPSWRPERSSLDNYTKVLFENDFLVNIGNSLIVALATTVLAMVLGVLAAFAIARFRFPGRNAASQLILMSYLTPMVLLFIPLSVVVGNLGLADTLSGLVLVYLTFAVPLCTWLVLGHFRGFPPDLEEAASLDGASKMRTLFSVLLPVSAPALATAASLTFVKGQDVMTAPVALQHLSTGDVQQYGPIMAGAVLSAIPVLAVYYISQRWVVQGAAEGAFKG